jgi:acetyltransferase-like isoleucine patch superfamily enzyme
MNGHPTRLDYDWFPGLVPANVRAEGDVFLDSAYSFAHFGSELNPGLELGEASGVYDRTAFLVGPRGQVKVGEYTCLNGTYVVCNERIEIGSYCFIGWSSVITDTWLGPGDSLAARRAALRAAAADPHRRFPTAGRARAVTIEDNVWIGFGAVILPGVTLGTGSVIGCKTVIAESVPAYAVVVGDPPRVVRYLEPTERDRSRHISAPLQSSGPKG